MAEALKRDQNHVTVQGAVTDDVNQTVEPWRADATTKRLLVSAVIAGSENGKILVDAADTTYDYIATKLVAGSGITLTVLNPGGNETLEIASVASLYYSTVQDNGVSVTQRPRLNFVDYFTVTDNAGNTSSDVDINIAQLEPALDLANIGGLLNLATQVTGLLNASNIDESSLDLANIGGLLNLATQVTGLLSSTNIDVTNLESTLDLGSIAGSLNLATQVTGTLPVGNGGTGATTLTGVLHGNGASAFTAIPLTTDGAILIGDGVGAPTTLNAFTSSTGNLKLANGGTGASLADPNADRILFWDDSAGQVTWLTAGSGLSISGTTISATGPGTSTFTAAEDLTAGDPVGTSALDADNVALANWYNKTVAISGASPSGFTKPCYIGNNYYAYAYGTGGTSAGAIAILEVDRATMTVTEVAQSSLGIGNLDSIDIAQLDTGKFICVYLNDGQNDVESIVGEWDGVTLNLTPAGAVLVVGTFDTVNICSFGTDRVAVLYANAGSSADVGIIEVTGTAQSMVVTQSVGDANFYNGGILAQVDTNKFVAITYGANGRCFEYVPGGPSITVGANNAGFASSSNRQVKSAVDGKFMSLAGTGGDRLDYCSISGTTITIDDSQAISAVSGASIEVIDANTFYLYESNNTIATSGLYEVAISGGNTIVAPVLISSRVHGDNDASIVNFTGDGYVILSKGAASTEYFIQGMSGNFIGIAQSTVARGASVSVLLSGVDANQTGLSSGTIYEVTNGGLSATLDITVPFKVLGQSSTEVVI